MAKFDEIINGDTPVLVDFYATWCAPCKAMHPILDELKRELGEQIRIVKLDIDKPANRPLADRFNVAAVPTLMIYNKGKMAWRRSGMATVSEIASAISELSDIPEELYNNSRVL